MHVDGSIADPAVTVQNAGTLGGIGTIGAVTVNSGGMLAPGASAGIFHTGTCRVSPGATFTVELGGTTAGQYDQLAVTGTVSLGGATLDLSLVNGFTPRRHPFPHHRQRRHRGRRDRHVRGSRRGRHVHHRRSCLPDQLHGGDGNDVDLTAVNGPPVTDLNGAGAGDNATASFTEQTPV